MTTTEAAAVLGKSPRTIQRMAETGRLPYFKKLPGPNGSYLFEPDAVQQLLADERKERM